MIDDVIDFYICNECYNSVYKLSRTYALIISKM